MSTATEPNIQTVAFTVTYIQLINVAQTDTMLAAPGLGSRYRIYGFSMAPVQNGTVCNLQFAIQAQGGTPVYKGTFANPIAGSPIWFPQGIPVTVNAAMRITTVCSVAGNAVPIVCNWLMYYVVEVV